jgi:lambda repressor-like predicted transcriptional regulator
MWRKGEIPIDQAQVVALLKSQQGDQSLRAFSSQLGVQPAYLCRLYQGTRPVNTTVLDFLGYEPQIIYTKKWRNDNS